MDEETLAYIVTYYGQKDGIVNHFEILNKLSEEYRRRLEVIVVNDGHKLVPRAEWLAPFLHAFHSFTCLSITEDIGFNNVGARNAGIDACSSRVVFMTDLDESIHPDHEAQWFDACMGVPESALGRFGHVGKRRPHPNAFACRKTTLDRFGWYNEAYGGEYGYDDAEFVKRWQHHGATMTECAFVLTEPNDTNFSDSLGDWEHRATVSARPNRLRLDRDRRAGYPIPTVEARCAGPPAVVNFRYPKPLFHVNCLSGPAMGLASITNTKSSVFLFRCGDMELQLGAPRTSDDAVNRIMRHHFGYRLRGDAGVAARQALRDSTKQAIAAATHLQLPIYPTDNLGYNKNVRAYCRGIDSMSAACTTLDVRYCDSVWFWTLLQHLKPKHLSVVSCRPGLPWTSALHTLESEVQDYPVQEQGHEKARFYPRKHVELLRTLTIREDGEVFLVAAGILSSDYLLALKQQSEDSGKRVVVLDIGSAIDRWAGVWSRKHVPESTWLEGKVFV